MATGGDNEKHSCASHDPTRAAGRLPRYPRNDCRGVSRNVWVWRGRGQTGRRPARNAEEFFDAIVCIDAYTYFGTDDIYLNRLVKFVKPGGKIGIVVAGLTQNFDGPVPDHLTRVQKSGVSFWSDDLWTFHTAEWWRNHWGRTNLVDVELADAMPDGCNYWARSDHALHVAKTDIFPSDAEAFEADQGRYIGLIRMVARKRIEEGQ